MKTKILIVDPDREFSQLLSFYLEPEGFSISAVHDGETAAKQALNPDIAAIILDIMLPKINGFEVLSLIRKHTQVPVLLLTARSDDIDRIIGLDLGADDYLLKPCNPRELVARLRAILRRSQQTLPNKPFLRCQNINLDCSKRIATLEGKFLDLTNAEFTILEILIKSPEQAFSKAELTEYALGRKYTAYDRSIDVHISNLRNKIGFNAKGESLVKTVRGFGYRFNTCQT